MRIALPSRLRAIGGLLSVLVTVGLCVPPPAAAEGAASRPAASANSRWLAAQLTPDGTLENPLGGTLPDHGLMIDVLFAAYASGDGDLAAPVVAYLERHATDYYTWDGLVPGMGFDNIIVGGATAKILVAAEVAGKDPRNFGGHDMVAETQGTIMRSGPDKGRISDYAKTPDLADYVSNNANMFGQALGVIGLAGAGANDQLAIDTMLTQQCGEGYFRIFFGYIPTTETGDQVTPNGYKVSTCDEGKAFDQSAPDGDTTGLALSAMLAARRAGAAGLDEPINRAVAWLRANQAASGGWGGGVGTEAPNTNSTGLIVQALADAGGADAEVARGVAYLESAQVTAADAGTALAGQVGAIAYNPESYQAARTDGIAGVDTWIRASAQASLGLSQVGFYDLTQGGLPEDPPPPGGGDGPPPSTGAGPPPSAPPVSDQAGAPAPPPVSRHGKPATRTVVTPPASQARPASATPRGALGSYLAGTLVDGDHVEVTENGRTYVDYGATAGLVLALRTLDEQPEAADRASRFLLNPDSIKAYAHGAPYEKNAAAYAEPLAKLRIIAGFLRVSADPPADLDATMTGLGHDLAALRGTHGRFEDTGEFGDPDDGVVRQAWVVLGLTAGPAAADPAGALDALIAVQCTDGTFPASLGTKHCATGDVTATAAAVEALNGRSQVVAPPSADTHGVTAGGREHLPPNNIVPDGWATGRAAALVRAATALTAATDPDGLVLDKDGHVDVTASAASAAGRQAAGLDASATTQALAASAVADGGFPRAGTNTSDLTTSIAAAPGLAGRSWTTARNAPVAAAVRLPLAPTRHGPAAPVAKAATDDATPWTVAAVLGFLLAVALGFGVRHLLIRRTTRKGVSQ